jgi:formate dehydrogenase subunit delta
MQPSDKLIRMANDIARNLAPQGEERAVVATADHIRRFWDPRMRAAVRGLAAQDGDRFHPIARQAIERVV